MKHTMNLVALFGLAVAAVIGLTAAVEVNHILWRGVSAVGSALRTVG